MQTNNNPNNYFNLIENWAKKYTQVSAKNGIIERQYIDYHNLAFLPTIEKIRIYHPDLNQTRYPALSFYIYASCYFYNDLTDSKFLKFSTVKSSNKGVYHTLMHFDFKEYGDLQAFFEFLKRFEKTISDALFEDILLELRITKSEQAIREEVIALANSGHVDEAITIAKSQQDKGNFNVIWDLIEFLKNETSVNDNAFLALLECVRPNNPHYIDAQDRLLHIWYDINKGEDEEHVIARFEIALRYALNSAKYNQVLVDQIFHKLCGYSSFTVVTPNIKGDYETLIALAQQTRSLTKKLNELEQRVSRLQCGKFYRNVVHDKHSLSQKDKFDLAQLKKDHFKLKF